MAITRDNGGRTTQISFGAGSIKISYDDKGRTSQVSGPYSSTLTYSYDGALQTGTTFGNIAFGAGSSTVQYEYDSRFRINGISVSGSKIEQVFDADSFLTKVGDLVRIRNNLNGKIKSETLGSVVTTFDFNSFGALKTKSVGTIYSLTLTYNQLGRIESRTETIEGSTTTTNYIYDAAGSMITAGTANYSFDAHGRRNDGGATYDPRDRVTSWPGGVTFTYDINGNRASKNGPEPMIYSYDSLGNLKAAGVITYDMDSSGRRIARKKGSEPAVGYIWDGSLKIIAQTDAAGAVTSRFVYADGINVPAYMIKGADKYTFVTDERGSVRLVLKSDGTLAQKIDYDAWGNVTSDTSPGFQPFGFAGGLYDVDTKLVRFGARDYDALVGQWTAFDPIRFAGGTTHLYEYSSNDPVGVTDPNGLATYTCQRPLAAGDIPNQEGRKTGGEGPNNPLFHEFLCTISPSGVTVCGGQTPAGNPFFAAGKPSNDHFEADKCDEKRKDDKCMEACLHEAFASPRPWYSLTGIGGTNCQEWAGEKLYKCSDECPQM